MYKQLLGTGPNVARSGATSRHHNNFGIRHLAISLAAIALLAACGGASGPDNDAPGDNNRKGITDQDEPQIKQVYAPSAQLANTCVTPASGEKQGTVNDEKSWVRSFVDERYLWYKDVPYVDASKYTSAAAYFEVLKTPAKNSTGEPLDRFHWSVTNAQDENWQAGVAVDYGIYWRVESRETPRSLVVFDVEPESPAGQAGILRGDKLVAVDGIDFVNANSQSDKDTINNGLFPKDAKSHVFEFNRAGELKTFTVAAGENYPTSPVRYKKIIDDGGTKVAYIYFDDFIVKSEKELTEAFSYFNNQGATELILDMRYNGGGYLAISQQLGYMIAGEKSIGKDFSRLIFNDKRQTDNRSYRFANLGINWSTGYFDRSKQLPTMNLSKVTMLVSNRTASASEELINALKGIDVTVNLVGKTTTGKPYGWQSQSNCGRTYNLVEFKAANAKNFSDYDAGFVPSCIAEDDVQHPLGDTQEAMLATALAYRKTGRCSQSVVSRLAMISKPEAYFQPKNIPRMIVTPLKNQ